MNISPDIFREYDIRGVADTDLTDDAAELIGKSFGTWLAERRVRKIVLGGDVRLSTERIRAAAARGVTSTGIDVVDIGVVTTPMLYWSLYHLNLEGAIMVTGSHNPPDMNGLKLVYGPGSAEPEKPFAKAALWGGEIQEIRTIAERGRFAANADGTGAGGTVSREDITDAYVSMLLSKISLGGGASHKPKVVCDSGNGTAGGTICRFLSGLGCECVSLYGTPDGRFPNHHPDPQDRENLAALIGKVRETGSDAGFAFDGDADRLGVVDERGEVIFSDRLTALYWAEILEKHPGAEAIIEPKCTMALPEEIERLGGRVVWWKSGHSLIKAKMKEIGALFAGELSGHMFFADEYYGFDDSFYAAARLLRIMTRSGKKLSQLMEPIPLYPSTEEARVACPDSEKFAVIGRIREKALKEYEGFSLDGVRIVYPGGWGLVRASNTQPVITTRCEGRDRESLAFIMGDVKKRILAEGLPDFDWTF
ncbi:MAG: phosphomannomutase/phosphoglucomutase [Synergistaceae bacterium]|jgi:phosphomannomutase/phosphoglucomutase|nr:phosphomannomutase/phosphoglucomutase [Synergistaceae bacterium]